MIIDFTVKNFRSIKEEQTFSMLASESKNVHPANTFPLEREKKYSLLKTGLIYGANASGKSNLITAIKALTFFINNSTDFKVEENIPVYEPYKLDKDSSAMPIFFEIEFIGNDQIRYKYSVTFDKQEVLQEELVFYPHKQEALLFSREKGKTIKFGSSMKGPRKGIAQFLIKNHLFLSKAANSDHKQLKGIYLYFRQNVHIITATKRDESVTFLLQKEFGKKFEDKITSFLTAADTGIQEVGLERAEMTASDFPVELPETVKKQFLEGGVYRTIAFHKLYDGEKEMGNIAFDLGEESIGTQRMYDLAGDVIFILETGGALIVDELDQSLHPHLCEYILQLFNDPETNPNNAQLIATTHDTTLLNPQLLRRDQIWFVTKDRMGASELFSLDEFKRDSLRNNTPFDKWYLEGRLGAIPNIDKTVFKVTAKDRKGNPDA